MFMIPVLIVAAIAVPLWMVSGLLTDDLPQRAELTVAGTMLLLTLGVVAWRWRQRRRVDPTLEAWMLQPAASPKATGSGEPARDAAWSVIDPNWQPPQVTRLDADVAEPESQPR